VKITYLQHLIPMVNVHEPVVKPVQILFPVKRCRIFFLFVKYRVFDTALKYEPFRIKHRIRQYIHLIAKMRVNGPGDCQVDRSGFSGKERRWIHVFKMHGHIAQTAHDRCAVADPDFSEQVVR
jgi:hypothetical protein